MKCKCKSLVIGKMGRSVNYSINVISFSKGKISQTEKCIVKYLTLEVISEGITDKEVAWL